MLIRIFLLTTILLVAAPAAAERPVPAANTPYDLQVSFDLPGSRLMGRASTPVTADAPWVFETGSLQIHNVQVDGKASPFAQDAAGLTVHPADTGLLTIHYEASFSPQESERPDGLPSTHDTITTKQIKLTGIWYPQPAHPTTYRLTARLPASFEAVSEGEHAQRNRHGSVTEFVFTSPHPMDHITLIASSRYTVIKDQVDGLELLGYFFPEELPLGRDLVARARETIAHYERRLTLFPHRRFSVVEIPGGAADSRSRRIALGTDQLQSPPEARATLGRAIARQWFGHLVRSPSSQSDWSEGLATYLADHYAPKQQRPAWQLRRAYLDQLSGSGDHGAEISLGDPPAQTDATVADPLRARGAMVFHMLNRLLGEERFFASLQDLIVWKAGRHAGWEDLQRVFQRHIDEDLSTFFDQWVHDTGVPHLEITDGAVQWEAERFTVHFELSQEGKAFSLSLPVTVRTVGGVEERRRIPVDRPTQKVSVTSDGEPATLVVDPDYDILRRLTDAEQFALESQRKLSAPPAGTDQGITLVLRETDIPAIDLGGLQSLSGVIEAAAEKKIVYVGEQHDQFAHHRVQLQVAEDLYRRHPKLAIGMEMFQRPSQQALDDYIAGLTTEREFLKASEYFDRWRMNYNLYKPILDFARRKGIPVIALNTPQELTRKVGRQGLASLTEEEKKLIPQDLDFSDHEYRARLKAVFERHQKGSGNFEYFHQAQILWDETMAEGIDRFLRSNPDYQMLVIVGSGHLAFDSGIPNRAYRRNGYDYAVILNDMDVRPGVADYIVYPAPMKTISAPKLMVLLEEKGERVQITGFPQTSVSQEAGLRVGDLLTALDDATVKSVADIKIALLYKRPEETVKVRVIRKRLLGSTRTLTFEVKLR